ncbi:hypothetical protein KF728_24160 [Candidatus Obscuribacterales bacterium]|jgi:hypothetical protein|nr:hypothetical protein [Candidatus Obscuribacterales bacterium]MBX3153275.1 hypothetical protein [Candidatus Obscuribacterales bacterium]
MRHFTKMLVAAAVVLGVTGAPAYAQSFGDAFSSQGSMGEVQGGNNTYYNTGAQTEQIQQGAAPILQGATNGTIGPQGGDATSIMGVNTAGTVRVNNLANLEALLNIIANGMEILGIAWGGPTMIMGFMHMAAGSHDAMKKVLFGAAGVTGGLATPGCINWLVASARDANLFS